jgi:hypothetical protein
MFRKVTYNILGGVASLVFMLGVMSLLLVPVVAQQRSPAARMFSDQQTHYWRFSVNFNSCVYVGLTCSVKVASVPYNAFIVRAYQQVTTTWNAGTSAAVALGTAVGSGNIVASQVMGAAGAATALTVAGLGIGVTGNGIAQTGTLGGFDIYATILVVGALPTAGASQYVIEYIAPNDGSCTSVPIGATAPAC